MNAGSGSASPWSEECSIRARRRGIEVRLHPDVPVHDIDQGVSRVLALGGRSTGERHDHDEGVVVVTADPEGREFWRSAPWRGGSVVALVSSSWPTAPPGCRPGGDRGRAVPSPRGAREGVPRLIMRHADGRPPSRGLRNSQPLQLC
ncbi:VOC family protein [Streptomyces sp. NPDC057287]|uniref:VOC family protein n=1 Tax=Streptomyces sp. NPDC057287 TaxID=3346086 RepID=UPI00362CF3ED